MSDESEVVRFALLNKSCFATKRQPDRVKKAVFFSLLFLFFLWSLWPGEYRITGSLSNQDREEIENILDHAEESFLPLFKLDNNFQLHIHVCKDLQEFLKLTGASWWNGGHFQNQIIFIQRPEALREREILEQTLDHEFLHYCISRVGGNSVPTWLNEGIVLNLNNEMPGLDCDTKATGIPLGKLDEALHGKDAEAARAAYCEAGRRVRRMIMENGFESILHSLDPRKSFCLVINY